MEFKMNPYKVYTKVNENGYIAEINSSAFILDTTGWIEIDSGYGDKYHHAQGNYFDKPIMTFSGAYQYKLIDNEVVECSEDEIAEQEAANKPVAIPTTEERVDALEAAVMMLCMPDIDEV